jgi:D-alanyl-D-alanine carboxypeptidase
MKRFYTLLLLLSFFVNIGCTQQPDKAKPIDKAKLDQYFKTLDHHQKFMGSVAITKNGQTIYTKTIGFSDVEAKTKPNENTRYRIGSISKTFTTVLIFKAIEENKLKLDQTLDKYFPAIPNAAQINLALMLNHRSGIHSFTDNADYLTWNTQPKTEQEMLDLIIKGGSNFEPDSKAAYSNSNFILLTYILEKVYKKPFADILNEKIISPLDLKHTHAGGKINPAQNESYSYKFNNGWVKEPETDSSIPLGAGSLVSTPGDLNRFAEALFSNKLISEEHVSKMKTIKDNFGMGVFAIPFYEKTGYGHTGGIDGFASVFAFYPDDQISVSITSNGSAFPINGILVAMLSSVYGKDFGMPVFKTYDVAPEDLDQYTGTYSSTELPLKITITKSAKGLVAQATGQAAFNLDATAKDIFQFDQAGIEMEFNPEEKQMILRQGGGVFHYVKE